MAFTLVLCDEYMGLYEDNLKIKEGLHLSMGDILDGCGIQYKVESADVEWDKDVRMVSGLPEFLDAVKLDGDE